MSHIPENLAERAQWHLCLSHAFLIPDQAEALDALRDDLLADLNELNDTLKLVDDQALEQLQQTLQGLAAQQDLLLIYSRLFLAPPAPALLNLGFYIDGALMGHSCQQVEDLYMAHGLERDPAFRDTADHLALYLQFIGWLHARIIEATEDGDHEQAQRHLQDAYATLHRHALPAMQRLVEQIDKAQQELNLPKLYDQLIRLAYAALLQDAAAIHAVLPDESIAPAEPHGIEPSADSTGQGEMSHCQLCGKPFLAEAGLQHMIDTLAEKGLGTDHLLVCADCRARAMGMQPVQPPKAKKAAHG